MQSQTYLLPDSQTVKDGWHTVVRDVTVSSAEIWCGVLKSGLPKPVQGRVRYRAQGGDWQVNNLAPEWTACLTPLKDRYFQTFTLNDLIPNTVYQWELWLEYGDGQPASRYGQAEFKTLPSAIQGADDPFTLMLASCFHESGDHGEVEHTYRALCESDLPSPDLTFLAGDQVYLDVGLGPIFACGKKGIARHIANTYQRHWKAFGEVLNRGATWMMADDHELWNGFPDLAWYNPFLVRFHSKRFRQTWEKYAREATINIQGCRESRQLSIGDDLHIMTLDTRLSRTHQRILNDDTLVQAIDWINNLTAPGVLVLTQSLTDPPKRIGGRKLATFSSQYLALCDAILNAEHDLVMLCGDLHYGRVAEGLNLKGRRLIEVIASPLSNVKGLASLIALNTPPANPIRLPSGRPHNTNSITLQQHNVVPWETGLFKGYLKKRTEEHFQTLGFHRHEGQLHLNIKAWKVRGPADARPFCYNWPDAHWILE